MAPRTPGPIGIAGPADHPVFSVVADRLRDRDHEIAFFDPHDDVPRDVLAGLSAFVVKRTRPASVRSLVAAERLGVPTWNSATGVMCCVSHLVQLRALAHVGFTVPACSVEEPDGPYVAKSRYHWGPDPEVRGEGAVYEPLLDAEPVDYKYYAVDDGEGLRTTVLRATSKLDGEKRILGEGTPVPAHVDRLPDLVSLLGMRGLGVDLVRVGEEWYAVDLNPCPSFERAGLVENLVASIEACLN